MFVYAAWLKGLPSTAGGPLVDSNRTRFGATPFPQVLHTFSLKKHLVLYEVNILAKDQ